MWIIDGYNLLFKSPGRGSLQQRRDGLLRRIELSKPSGSICVVFDGRVQHPDIEISHRGALEVVYTNKGESADQWIIERISMHPRQKRGQIRVVTSDRPLQREVAALGAYYESTEMWLERLFREQEPSSIPPLTRPLQAYHKIFEERWQRMQAGDTPEED